MLANQIGYYSLILGLLFSFSLCTIAIQDFNKVNKKLNANIIILTFLQLTFVIVSFFSLILSFINSDFSNETVFNNSHTTKPLFYKISGTWGNHEGSLLLWLLVLTLFIFLFLIFIFSFCLFSYNFFFFFFFSLSFLFYLFFFFFLFFSFLYLFYWPVNYIYPFGNLIRLDWECWSSDFSFIKLFF